MRRRMSFQGTKPGRGEQFLSLDCRVKAHERTSFVWDTGSNRANHGTRSGKRNASPGHKSLHISGQC